MVSPVQTDGQDATNAENQSAARAAVSGEAIAYASRGSFGSAAGANFENELISRRGPEGWQTQNVTPLVDPHLTEPTAPYLAVAFTPELSEGLARTMASLTPEAPATKEIENDQYLVDLANGEYRYIAKTQFPLGASTDLSRVVFVSDIPRLPSGKVLRRVLKERYGCTSNS